MKRIMTVYIVLVLMAVVNVDVSAKGKKSNELYKLELKQNESFITSSYNIPKGTNFRYDKAHNICKIVIKNTGEHKVLYHIKSGPKTTIVSGSVESHKTEKIEGIPLPYTCLRVKLKSDKKPTTFMEKVIGRAKGATAELTIFHDNTQKKKKKISLRKSRVFQLLPTCSSIEESDTEEHNTNQGDNNTYKGT